MTTWSRIENRNSSPSTIPIAVAGSRTTVAAPSDSRPINPRYSTDPTAARTVGPSSGNAGKPLPGRMTIPASRLPDTASTPATRTTDVTTKALAGNTVSRRGNAVSRVRPDAP